MDKLLLIVISFLSLACTAAADSINAKRLLFIEGPITRGTLAPVRAGVEVMVEDSKEPITLVLSSPGGEVLAGMSLVNYMQSAKALGVRFNCYVLDMAASMAFQILTQCNTRHSLPTSFLLWHGVRTGGGTITTEVAKQLVEDLGQMDGIIREQLQGSLSMSDEEIERHFQAETLWTGLELSKKDKKFMTLHRSYPEIVEALPKAIRSAKYNPFSFLFGDDLGIWYIWRSFDLTRGQK